MEKRKYKQLSITEREIISILKEQHKSLREIAKELNRDPTTICRELKRNAPPVYTGYYLAHKAHQRAGNRKSKAHQRQRLKNDTISAYVQEKLSLGWSPEQISGRLSKDNPEFSISHEAVYQYIYKEHAELIPLLARSHKKRHQKGHSRKHKKSHIPNRVSIQDRPEGIATRKHIGHWESDTMVSRQSTAALLLLIERKSRVTLIEKLQQKTALANSQGIITRLEALPQHLKQTITYDNGSENTEHETVNQELQTRSYFCNPYHSWEKGSVENAAGLVRRIFPKKTNFADVTASEIATVENSLNNRPRKCLKYLTPLEAMANECVALTR
jgi:IS30 family transposase